MRKILVADLLCGADAIMTDAAPRGAALDRRGSGKRDTLDTDCTAAGRRAAG